ncbi:hypothetical protein [Maribacter halichondriae]|uniref:hypothetical protein n=1 Tax=Maribacter halichondriae TaxID=2980554 RepID=UPI0023590B27|nr:hypothetical protein [Maribacter sp. Hal144]
MFKQRIYAALLFVGAGVLLTRTIIMLSQGALETLTWWASALLLLELLIALACMVSSVKWFIRNDQSEDHIPLRLGAAITILHAFRVLIFVIGRAGPWVDFDIRPGKEALHWNWELVYFAAVMSVIGILGVIIIWRIRRRSKKDILDHANETQLD